MDETRRGQGWGRELMTRIEEWAIDQGAHRIRPQPLFGGTAVARGLYSALGYDEPAVSMSRKVGP